MSTARKSKKLWDFVDRDSAESSRKIFSTNWTSYIPKAWREVKVVFILEESRTDYTRPREYLPSFLPRTYWKRCRNCGIPGMESWSIISYMHTIRCVTLRHLRTTKNPPELCLSTLKELSKKTTFTNIQSALIKRSVFPTCSQKELYKFEPETPQFKKGFLKAAKREVFCHHCNGV